MKVLVVAEYYPRLADPAFGVWAHRQALAAQAAGVELRVLVLHRPIPPRSAFTPPRLRPLLAPLRQPRRVRLDGVSVRYVRFVAPPRWRSYASWSAWMAPPLRAALRSEPPFDLIHAHYAAPVADAVRRAAPEAPLMVSVHGGDVLAVARDSDRGRETVAGALTHARLVLANSAGTERRCAALGAAATRVVHLGCDLPPRRPRRHSDELVTVAHLIERKRHADVLRALWLLRDSHPRLRWTIVGDGPERPRLERLADELGMRDRLTFTGALPHAEAVAHAQRAGVFVLPSVDEAFGVAYVEAMAGAVPAIGCRGEDGPEEIARTGDGMALVPPGEPDALARTIAALADDPTYRAELGDAARATVERAFTWDQCGEATRAAYEAALR